MTRRRRTALLLLATAAAALPAAAIPSLRATPAKVPSGVNVPTCSS